MIGWVDVETTGLGVDDDLLEIAVVITDDDLNELDAFEQTRRPAGWEWLDRIVAQEEVLAMHSANGLIVDLVGLGARPTTSVDRALSSWLGSAHGNQTVEYGMLVMGGSSVGFDRRVLGRWLPESVRWFHYRQIDVSSVTELCRRWWPSLADEIGELPQPHRALADVRRSIEILRRYRASGFIDGSDAAQKFAVATA